MFLNSGMSLQNMPDMMEANPPIMDDDDEMLLNSPLYLYMRDTETPDFDYNHFKTLLRTFPQYIQTTYPTNTLTAREILNLDDSSIISLAIENRNVRAFGILLVDGGVCDPHNPTNLQHLKELIKRVPLPQTRQEMYNFIKFYFQRIKCQPIPIEIQQVAANIQVRDIVFINYVTGLEFLIEHCKSVPFIYRNSVGQFFGDAILWAAPSSSGKVFIECEDDVPDGWHGNSYAQYIKKPVARKLLKINGYMVIKPDWYDSYIVPGTKFFQLVDTNEPVFKFMTTDLARQQLTDDYTVISSDHCNQKGPMLPVFRLEPITFEQLQMEIADLEGRQRVIYSRERRLRTDIRRERRSRQSRERQTRRRQTIERISREKQPSERISRERQTRRQSEERKRRTRRQSRERQTRRQDVTGGKNLKRTKNNYF
jgi:hypothetical protein